ncbi:MAG: ATP-binding cassette domain-containing protein, partial [Actinobacteria bacterium]|nr:ATP-binding cassette domain-containing protein [Actinomycetota bacterium]
MERRVSDEPSEEPAGADAAPPEDEARPTRNPLTPQVLRLANRVHGILREWGRPELGERISAEAQAWSQQQLVVVICGDIKRGKSSLLNALLDRSDHIKNEGKILPEKLRGEVAFKNVWFAYTEQDWVLKDISFHINPGETLALVGSTGSGKTSIISILNRLYETQKGSIEIDG